jgi:plastocyanin
VWRSYKNIALLDKDNRILLIDLGLTHSSAAKSLIDLYLNDLLQKGLIEDRISPHFLIRNWPPAFKEWSTKSVRDAFFASPQFPKLLDPSAISDTIASGVSNGIFAYVGRSKDQGYDPIYSNTGLKASDVEISEEMFIVKEPIPAHPLRLAISPDSITVSPGGEVQFTVKGFDNHGNEVPVEMISWEAFGGAIDNSGVFRAGLGEGTFTVKATSGDATGEAQITVKDERIELQRIIITPEQVTISPGSKQTFTVRGFDQKGDEVTPGKMIWEATGGVIGDDGIFQAGFDEGDFTVIARSGDVTGSAAVAIKRQVIAWAGDVPPQKWMNFYTKILSKFATRKGLKLRIVVEIPDATPLDIEEMRAALRDLSLDYEIVLE